MRPALRNIVAPVAIVALVALALAAGGHRRAAWSQEQDLPGVASDSIVTNPPRVPPVPGVPLSPGLQIDRRDAEEIRRHIHAGDNDIVKVGEDIEVGPSDHVLGDVFAMGGNVTVRGQVDGDVVAMGGDVSVDDGAQVRGDAVSLGGQVRKGPAAVVLGKTVTVGAFPKRLLAPRALWAVGHGVAFIATVTKFLIWLLIAWVIVSLFATRSQRVLAELRGRFGMSLLWGVLGLIGFVPALIAVVLVAALLCVTIIGIPVGVLLILGYCVAVVLLLLWGGVLGAARVGEWAIARLSPRLGEPTLVRSTLIGIVAVTLPGLMGRLFELVGLDFFPAGMLGVTLRVVGWVIETVVLVAGMGAVLHARAGQVDPIRMPWSGATPAPPAAPGSPPAAPVAPVPPAPPATPGAPETTV